MNGILSTRAALAGVAFNLAKNLKTGLCDFGFFRIGPLHSSAINAFATLAAVGLLGYGAYVLMRNGPRNATTFVLAGLTFPAVVLLAHDVAFGGGLVEQGRYFMPLYLARLHLRCDQCGITLPVDNAPLPDSSGVSDVFVLGSLGVNERANHRYVIGIKTFPLQPDPLNMFLSPQ
jgi:hypothetical protein